MSDSSGWRIWRCANPLFCTKLGLFIYRVTPHPNQQQCRSCSWKCPAWQKLKAYKVLRWQDEAKNEGVHLLYLLLTHTVLLLRLSRMKATNIVVGKRKKRLKVFRDLFLEYWCAYASQLLSLLATIKCSVVPLFCNFLIWSCAFWPVLLNMCVQVISHTATKSGVSWLVGLPIVCLGINCCLWLCWGHSLQQKSTCHTGSVKPVCAQFQFCFLKADDTSKILHSLWVKVPALLELIIGQVFLHQ